MKDTRLKIWNIKGFILFTICATLACNTLMGLQANTSNQVPDEVIVNHNVTFGSGTFNLSDLRAGLSNLISYKATLNISFNGTHNGQPQKWSKIYVMLMLKEPEARQLTIDTNNGVSNPVALTMAEMDGADYQVDGKKNCTASVVEPGNSLSDRLEPVSFLHYVIGAKEAGSETVNGVTTNHYQFDQNALGEQNLGQSSGEVWVASSGGFVVKYLLTTKAKADYFGDGIEGTLTSDYELTDVGKPVKIQLPAVCPAGMIDVPKLPDASNVDNEPGILTYTTSSSAADVAAFYQKQLPGLGWTLQGQVDVADGKALMDFINGILDISISITSDAGLTTVNIVSTRVQKK
jgi:hypothetical protein